MNQFRRIIVHDLLRKGDCILALRFRNFSFVLFELRRSLLGLICEEAHDGAFARRTLVYSKSCAELAMCSDLDRLEQFDCKVLAVVADEVVGGPFFAPASVLSGTDLRSVRSAFGPYMLWIVIRLASRTA